MEQNEVHFCLLMRTLISKKGKNSLQTIKKMCVVYGDDAVAESAVFVSVVL